jgi:hypothetical protein
LPAYSPASFSVVAEHRRRVEVVEGDVEEALDLPGVEVDGQHPGRPRRGQQVGDQLGRDRRARLDLAVLPRIPEVGHQRDDAARAGPLQRVDHDQQFHQIAIRRAAGRLHQEAVDPAHVLADLDEDLSVREALDPGPALDDAQVLAQLRGQRSVRVATKDGQGLVHGSGSSGARRSWGVRVCEKGR